MAVDVTAGTASESRPGNRQTKPVRRGTVIPAGCAAFPPKAARLIGVRAVSRNPVVAQGEEKLNKNELVSHVASETSVTKATADRMVGAVFSAIGDALARDEPVAIAGFGTFFTRTRAPRRGRNPRTGEIVDNLASTTPAFKASKKLRDTVSSQG